MRIALVTREYPPETAWGGIGSFYASLAVSLVEAGHEVEVFAQGLESEGVTEQDGVRVTRVMGLSNGLGHKASGSLAGNDDLGLFALGLAHAMHAAVARRHAEEPFDLIEGHEHLGVNALINDDPGLGAVTVTRYHSAYHSLVRRGLADWPESRLIEALERASIRKADRRISTSEVISAVVVEDFGARPADVILPNFVRASGLGWDWRRKRDQVLFAGRLVLTHKRPDIAVEAFLRFARARPTWRMIVAGPDQDHADHGTVWNALKSRIPEDMADRIDYVGALPQADVYRLMADSKALLMPSDFESFGMVAVEAMQHGCLPLVASDTATANVVPDPRLVRERGSVDSFVEGLEALLSDEAASGAADLARSLGAHAIDAFSEARILDRNLAFFEQVQAAREPRSEPATMGATGGPLVSVVVPNFNGARFLEETLQSLVDQDYPRLEIIVADGGSTDDSAAIVARFPSVTLIQERDAGQAHAINRGLLRARGDILAYLNSDDVYRPGAVRDVVEHFRRDPEAKILCGCCEYIDEDSQVIGALIQPRFSGQQGVIRYWGWEKWHTLPQQAVFWRRELTERIGLFDTRLHFVMDLDYWIRAAGQFDFKLVPETLAAFRLVTGTKTVSQTDRMYAEEYEAFRRYRNLLPPTQRAVASIAARRHYSRKLLDFADHLYLGEGLRRRALALAGRSIRVFPARLADLRVWLMIGDAMASRLGLGGLAERLHRRALRVLWRLRRDG